MKKNEYKIYTSETSEVIPKNVIIIKDRDGWTYLMKEGVIWYVNSTPDGKDIPMEEDEKFLKKLVKAIKEQKKLI